MFTFKLLRVERYFAVRRDMNKILQLNVLISEFLLVLWVTVRQYEAC